MEGSSQALPPQLRHFLSAQVSRLNTRGARPVEPAERRAQYLQLAIMEIDQILQVSAAI